MNLYCLEKRRAAILNSRPSIHFAFCILHFAFFFPFPGASRAADAPPLAIRAKSLHTMAGPAIRDGVVLIRDGKIERVGAAVDIRIPDGWRVIDAEVATPGLVDAHSTVGLTGYLNQDQDQDVLERSESIQPELRAIDAYNPQERLVEWVRGFGITTLHTGHAPGEIVSGQTMIVKTWGATVDDAIVVPQAMIAATLGDWATKDGGKSPGTRSKAVSMLRAELMRAQAYLKKRDAASKPENKPDASQGATDQAPGAAEPGSDRAANRSAAQAAANGEPPRKRKPIEPGGKPKIADPSVELPSEDDDKTANTTTASAPADSEKKDDRTPPDRDLRLEALGRVLNREIPLLVTVHRAHDIMTTLRLAKEFDIRIVLDGAAESYLVIDEIKAAGVPVIVHPTMMRAGRGTTENASMETAALLHDAGIPIAMQSGYESYVPKTRVVLFETGIAAANGLSFDEALYSCTLGAAKILGIDRRVGSLEAGKDADVALYDGDPFEYTTHCTGVVIDGRVVVEGAR